MASVGPPGLAVPLHQVRHSVAPSMMHPPPADQVPLQSTSAAAAAASVAAATTAAIAAAQAAAGAPPSQLNASVAPPYSLPARWTQRDGGCDEINPYGAMHYQHRALWRHPGFA